MTDTQREHMTRLKADTIREDGRLERHCEHGIGHTVGHLDNEPLGRYGYVHGCDGCCRGYLYQDEPAWQDDTLTTFAGVAHE